MANQNNKEKPLLCNFCGKSQDEVGRMIIGPGVNICNECIELCASLLWSLPMTWLFLRVFRRVHADD